MTEYNAKIQEIEERLSAAEAELRALKAEKGKDELPTPPHPRWKPSCGEFYYVLSGNGHIETLRWSLSELKGDITDKECFSNGNVFRTEEDAENVAMRRKVLAEMREWAGHNYDGAYIYYHRPSDEILTNWNGDSTYCFGDIHFKCVDDAKNCIKAVGKERIKKYYFRVLEDEDDG